MSINRSKDLIWIFMRLFNYMYESKHQPLAPRHVFRSRLLRNILRAFAIIIVSLAIGMFGYHHFEHMPWVDAFENASMILSGMGPVKDLQTESGKIFAGLYALFSGIIFLVAIAVVMIPIFHRFFHKFHIEDSKSKY